MKKIMSIMIVGMFLISFAFVSAQNTITEEGDSNFFKNIWYKLSKLGLFTAEGQSRSCDINAREVFNVEQGDVISKSEFLSYCGGNPAFLVDVFDTGYGFKNEYRGEIIGSGLGAGSDGIWELYCCPYEACQSDNDCSSPPASNYGNTCNTGYGACYDTLPSHETDLYNCNTVTGDWISAGDRDYGQERFCSDPSDNNYQSETGGEGCYSSPPSGWCTQQLVSHYAVGCYNNDVYWYDSQANREDKKEECGSAGCSDNACNQPSGECTEGDTKCEGEELYVCSDGDWARSGFHVQCGYEPPQDCNTDADTNCDGQVAKNELGQYIVLWQQGSVNRVQLGEVIQAWANG